MAEQSKSICPRRYVYQGGTPAEVGEIDVQMGEVEDRFVQAEVINSAEILAEGDAAMIEKADRCMGGYTDAAARISRRCEANLEATLVS
ncbi:MAG: hypothetical protein IPH82_21700 [Chloroflexi bacterium]|nr:hypothetical protein [Chloroflexota bacterium]